MMNVEGEELMLWELKGMNLKITDSNYKTDVNNKDDRLTMDTRDRKEENFE